MKGLFQNLLVCNRSLQQHTSRLMSKYCLARAPSVPCVLAHPLENTMCSSKSRAKILFFYQLNKCASMQHKSNTIFQENEKLKLGRHICIKMRPAKRVPYTRLFKILRRSSESSYNTGKNSGMKLNRNSTKQKLNGLQYQELYGFGGCSIYNGMNYYVALQQCQYPCQTSKCTLSECVSAVSCNSATVTQDCAETLPAKTPASECATLIRCP